MMPMLPPPASPSPLAGEGRAPASPSPLVGEGRGGGSAVRIVKKLRVRNPHHLTAAGSVAGQRIVQPPTIEHPLEVRQPRSEERRVGKEWRCRRWAEWLRKKQD